MTDILNITACENREDYQLQFDRMAVRLLNEYELRTPGNSYQIREIEFYYFSENHTDFYCHKHERQSLYLKFYFHRFKDPERYLRLKQKGVDLTFGDQKHNFGGILLRTIQQTETGELITGPANLVNRIIEEIGGAAEIVNLYMKNKDAFNNQTNLYLAKAPNHNLKVFRKPRKGLNLKKEDTDRFFLNAAYNYFTYSEINEAFGWMKRTVGVR